MATTEERLVAVLSALPWIAKQEFVSVAELAEQFSLDPAAIEQDLLKIACCGLPPYSPDALLDVQVADGEVSARFVDYFTRPLRLTTDEAVDLLLVAETALATVGPADVDALRSAVEKLREATGLSDALKIVTAKPADLHQIAEAVDLGKQLEIEYYSYSRNEVGTRTVDPLFLLSLNGNWYLYAFCLVADDYRTFRIDRILSYSQLPEPVTHVLPDDFEATDAATVANGDLVSFGIAPGAAWVADVLGGKVKRGAKSGPAVDVLETVVTSGAALERVLVAYGDVLEPLDRDELGRWRAEAASKMLAVYH